MKIGLLIFSLSLALNASSLPDALKVSRLRTLFYEASTDEKFADTLMYELKNIDVHTDAIYEGYMGIAYMLKAKHAWNPYMKLKYFHLGKSLLESSISSQPDHIEIRYLRLTVQIHAPAFLAYRNHIDEDKKFIRKRVNKIIDPDLKQKILLFLNENVQI